MVLMRNLLGPADMHSDFEAKLIETFERTPSFKGFSDGELSFEISRHDKREKEYKTIKFSIGLTYKGDAPVFMIMNYNKTILRNSGHSYADGVLCHNIPSYKASEKYGEWYAKSIIEFINSLELVNKKGINDTNILLLKSVLPENDLIEYERISHGSFSILLNTSIDKVVVGQKYQLRRANTMATPPRFELMINQLFVGFAWKVIEIDGSEVTLINGTNTVKTLFQPSNILEEINNNPKSNIIVIGAGSLGSYFIANYVKDYLNGDMTIIDGDIYLYGNKDRHYLGMQQNTFFINKADALKNNLYRDILKHKSTNKINVISEPIGLRTRNGFSKQIDTAIKEADIVVDLTGRNESLAFLIRNFDCADKLIYKASLYDSGNVMIASMINQDDEFEDVINEWNEKRIKNNLEVHSAYTSESPANNTRVSLNAAILNEIILTNEINKGEYLIYDWRKNIRKTWKANS